MRKKRAGHKSRPTIIQMQKEIESESDDYPDGSIAKEIDDQLKLIKEKFF